MQKFTIAELTVRIDEMEKTVEYLNKIVVRGNGQPSLVASVSKITDFISEWKENYTFWSRAIVGAAVANIVGFIFAAIAWFIRVQPLLDKISSQINNKP